MLRLPGPGRLSFIILPFVLKCSQDGNMRELEDSTRQSQTGGHLVTSLKNLGQKGQLLPLSSMFAFIPYLVGENSSSSTTVNYFNKEDKLQKEPPSKREREKNKNKTLDLNLNWTCDYRERRRWLYFFN